MKKLGLVLGFGLFAVMLYLPPMGGLEPPAWRVLAMGVLMLVWWITEAIPIPATSLLPIVLLPLLQVSSIKAAAAPYADPVVFLFMGGFMLALAMEKWNLHRRIALNIVKVTGTNANRIILGFMLATFFLSMWISNTATTVMMLPIAASVISLLFRRQDVDLLDEKIDAGQRAFAIAIMLGIAYGANIGGMATLIGTPPNVVFKGYIESTFGLEVSFGKWMLFATPFSLLLLAATYFLLVKLLYRNGIGQFSAAEQVFNRELKELGTMPRGERITFIIFVATALCWIFSAQLNQLLGLTGEGVQKISDHVIALLASLALFITPVDWKNQEAVLTWQDTEKLPWGILLLFGGGMSLAAALETTGLIKIIGEQFNGMEAVGFLIILGLTAVSLYLTEIMSNVALVTVLLPVVGAVATGINMSPLLLCIPVTLAASCAFMLPMSTPPNAIVFASGHLRIVDMVRAGFWLNLISILLIAVLCYFVLPVLFG